MTSDEIDNVLREVTAILNSRNVNYIPDPAAQGEDKVMVGSEDPLDKFCQLLSIDKNAMLRALISRELERIRLFKSPIHSKRPRRLVML